MPKQKTLEIKFYLSKNYIFYAGKNPYFFNKFKTYFTVSKFSWPRSLIRNKMFSNYIIIKSRNF